MKKACITNLLWLACIVLAQRPPVPGSIYLQGKKKYYAQ